MKKEKLLRLLLLSFSSIALSQNETSKDTLAILSFADKVMVKVNVDTQTDSYVDRDNTSSDLRLSANNNYRLTLSLDYKLVGFSFGFSPRFISSNNDDDLKGKYSFSDYQFRGFLGKWTQEVYYKKSQGFYVENTGDFDPSWREGIDPYLQFPDLKNTP
ncbi:MAG: hypothetical protein ACI849_000004 [Patiriisocius sp.]